MYIAAGKAGRDFKRNVEMHFIPMGKAKALFAHSESH